MAITAGVVVYRSSARSSLCCLSLCLFSSRSITVSGSFLFPSKATIVTKTNNYTYNYYNSLQLISRNGRTMTTSTEQALVPESDVDDIETVVRKRKQVLRKHIRTQLRNLDKDTIMKQSVMVWEQLKQLNCYKEAKTIGLFLSMPYGEINTDPLIAMSVQDGKIIYVPQVGTNFQQSDMELLQVPLSESNNVCKGNNDEIKLFHHYWKKNKWGIPEPDNDNKNYYYIAAKPGDIDLLIIPGLAFDINGNRLGQGKGYYDRFLSRMMNNNNNSNIKEPILIAVGLDCQLIEEENDNEKIPTHDHDHPVQYVITPSKLIHVQKNY